MTSSVRLGIFTYSVDTDIYSAMPSFSIAAKAEFNAATTSKRSKSESNRKGHGACSSHSVPMERIFTFRQSNESRLQRLKGYRRLL